MFKLQEKTLATTTACDGRKVSIIARVDTYQADDMRAAIYAVRGGEQVSSIAERTADVNGSILEAAYMLTTFTLTDKEREHAAGVCGWHGNLPPEAFDGALSVIATRDALPSTPLYLVEWED